MNPYFFADALVTYSLLALSLHDARKRGWHVVWQLLAGVLFGVILEWATIQQLHAYQYGQFPIMIADEVPLAIGVGWGVIIYASRLYAEATSLPSWAKPVLAALLALNIDLSMDAIAIRLGMWDWGQGLDFQYFGVPWANFWAWFWVVLFFSAGIQWFANGDGFLSRWLGPVVAVVLGVAGVLMTNRLIVSIVPRQWYEITITLVIVGALVLILALRPRLVSLPLPAVSKWTPWGFHLFFLATGLISGVILHPPVLLIVSLAMAAIAWRLHTKPGG